ncbi:hypothetical protein T440DRAFT_438011 [Plenodomus tracheiphilus IPT5]|uniref:Uncharacterized protein n=1 Tax=Plenodomus tracheiphilus IPT5 TaxID=1408161 RepID=A0A6A7BNA5_9PLEO|nr:hypothetical protein T440DRAFT_438011 [Plenodomus tracheiphilus IPT5]
MSTDPTTICDTPAEETAPTILKVASNTAPRAHSTADTNESQDMAASTTQSISTAPPPGAETEPQTASKTEGIHEKVPLTEQDTYLLADAVIANMNHLQTTMEALRDHINTQLNEPEEKPLYQWEQYTDYDNIGLAISSLGLAVTALPPSHLPEIQASSYRCRARAYSTAISKLAIFILSHTNKRCTTCIDEIEASNLALERKQAAQTHITTQVSKILENCSRATTSIWQAFDHLEKYLQPIPSQEITSTVETAVRKTIASMLDNYKQNSIAEYNHRVATEPSANYSRMMVLLWFVVSIFCFYLAARDFLPATTSTFFTTGLQHTPPQTNHDIHHQTIHLLNRTHALTNLTTELYTLHLADLDTRFKALELVAESNGLRIDNLVDALGMPNAYGNYYASVQNGGVEGVRQRVEKLQEDVEGRLKSLQGEVGQMRKFVNRMDLRLTARVDKVIGWGR